VKERKEGEERRDKLNWMWETLILIEVIYYKCRMANARTVRY
jgi:hypothetical protein